MLAMTNNRNKARSNTLAMAVLMAGTFVYVLDFFIVNVAIPSTQADLGASDSQIQLMLATYAIALASLLLLGGRLGDLFGRRRLFMSGLALFTASSALCGAAPGITVLLVGRTLQGVGAALFAPQVLSSPQPLRPRLAHLLPGQRADRDRRASAGAAGRATARSSPPCTSPTTRSSTATRSPRRSSNRRSPSGRWSPGPNGIASVRRRNDRYGRCGASRLLAR
jgi:hypothetical protein